MKNYFPTQPVIWAVVSLLAGICIGALLNEPALLPNVFHDLLPAFVTFIAAYAGARYAFDLTNKKDEQRLKAAQRTAGNRAVVTMALQMNKLANIKMQHLDALRNNPGRMLAVAPLTGVKSVIPRVELASLDFLVDLGKGDLLGRLYLAEDQFMSALEAVEQRTRLHFTEVQPKLELAGIAPGIPLTEEKVYAALGVRTFDALKTATDDLYTLVDTALIELIPLCESLSNVVKEIPGGGTVAMAQLPPEATKYLNLKKAQ